LHGDLSAGFFYVCLWLS